MTHTVFGQTDPEVIFMHEIPVGLAMALAEDEKAMHRFALLSDRERRQVVEKARQAGSRDRMQAIVQELT